MGFFIISYSSLTLRFPNQTKAQSYFYKTSHTLVQKMIEKGMVVCMRNRAEEIKKRIANRRKEKNRKSHRSTKLLSPNYHVPSSTLDNQEHQEFPLFNKEVFIFKLLMSACIVLITAILFKNSSPQFDQARQFVTKTMKEEFQFAAVAGWYEDLFGKPLALFPRKEKTDEETTFEYALPASNFQSNKEGIMIETATDAPVKAMNKGLVIFTGVKDSYGKTVMIQHEDKSISWYGHLGDIKVGLYERVDKNTEIGTVSNHEDGSKGEFYFAIEKDNKFIDPTQVITFE